MEGEEELVYEYEYEGSFHASTVLDPNDYSIKSFDSFPKDFFDEYNEKKHPFMAEITLPVLDPNTGMYCIGFRKSGVPLEEYSYAQRRNFCDMHLIKEPYQSIVIDLLYVTRHLSQQNFEANFDGSIMVSTPTGSRKPMIVLVDVGTAAVAKPKKSWWEQLATFLEKINGIISYNPGSNTEMSTFIRYLRSGCRAPTEKESHNYLARLPLFWTPTERRIFVGDHWDLTKKMSNGVAVYGHKPVYTNHPAPPHYWRTVVENELPWLVRANGANGALDPAIPFMDTRGVRSKAEEETRAASSFARSWLVHTEQNINNLQALWGPEDLRVTSELRNEEASVELTRKVAAGAYTFGNFSSSFYEEAREAYERRKAQHARNQAFYGDFNAVKLHRKLEGIFPRHVERLQLSGKMLEDALMPCTEFRSPTNHRQLTLLVPLRQELVDDFDLPLDDDDLPDECDLVCL